MKKLLPLATLAVSALALAACNAPAESPATEAESATGTEVAAITVTDPWCRPTPNGARVAGCYVTLTAASDDVLTGIATDLATMPQVHEMKHEDGMMKMAHLEQGLHLPAGEAVVLKPGSNHLMLMGLTTPLVEGQTARLTLQFEKAEDITVEAAIRTPPVVGSEE
ncbi:copper chaperone PCu(A)C [Brevundimonas vesicularis]|uniref:copper chaperone PCu(A)C n=1 Tax=Brevundimonas vesicularis TaxID=41276 RepID=UPI0038D42427